MMSGLREDIWQSHTPRKPCLWHGLVFILLTVAGAYAQRFGWLPLEVWVISGFGVAAALEIIGGAWFGIWGILASIAALLLFNFLSVAWAWPIAAALLPAHLLRAGIAAWAFRHFRADLRLSTSRDWYVWSLWGVLVANVLGAAASAAALYLLKAAPPVAYWPLFWSRFLGDAASTWVLGTIGLTFLSPLIVRTRAFCKGYIA